MTGQPRESTNWEVVALVLVCLAWGSWHLLSAVTQAGDETAGLALVKPLYVALVAAGILALWTARPSRAARLAPDADTTPRDPRQKMLLASLPALALVIWLLGAALGIALYLVVVGRLLGERRWVALLALAACAAGIVFVGFVQLLGVPLPLLPG